MDDLVHLPQAVHTQILRVLESSLNVRHRGEFFMWAQGQLQSLVPHGLMIGMTINSAGRQTHCECLQAVPLKEGLLAQIQHPDDGLLTQIERLCHSTGQASRVLPLSDDLKEVAGADWVALDSQWQHLELGSAQFIASGDLGLGERVFFALMCQPQVADPVQQLILRALLPQLLVLLWRARQYATQKIEAQPAIESSNKVLTDRQLEILQWVQLGKTNNEIAQIVAISELTVKNHLQKIFKRLNVHNRTQAVAKMMALDSA
jgi:transcriptional regulator EpsA